MNQPGNLNSHFLCSGVDLRYYEALNVGARGKPGVTGAGAESIRPRI